MKHFHCYGLCCHSVWSMTIDFFFWFFFTATAATIHTHNPSGWQLDSEHFKLISRTAICVESCTIKQLHHPAAQWEMMSWMQISVTELFMWTASLRAETSPAVTRYSQHWEALWGTTDMTTSPTLSQAVNNLNTLLGCIMSPVGVWSPVVLLLLLQSHGKTSCMFLQTVQVSDIKWFNGKPLRKHFLDLSWSRYTGKQKGCN